MEYSDSICEKEDCCGCTACMSICPNDAITMVADEEGFYTRISMMIYATNVSYAYRYVPFVKVTGLKTHDQPIVYAAKHRDYNVRINSSSGGMFTAISITY